MSFEWVEIGELQAKKNGSIDPSKFLDETFELHSIPSHDKGNAEILTGREIGSSKQIVQENDVMISKIVPHIRRAMVVPKKGDFRQIASGEWIVFRSEKVYPNYLRHLLISDFFNAEFMATVSGVGGSLLRARPAFVSKIKIPLPPLSEQKRISKILDKADELRQKRQQSIEKLDELLQATFIDMFGDPVTNPKGWKVKKLADLGSIATGNTPPRANPENYGNFMEWIKSDNLNHSFDYATKATEYLSEIGAKKARVVPSGTILVTCIAGSFDCIGNLAIVDREVAFNQQINSLTPNDENDTLFLYYLLKISKHIIQSSSTKSMKGMISKSKFSEITLPIPPFEEQIKFSKVFENFNSLKKTALSQLEHQENLFQSLQQRAFKGEL
nr:restriction endonuclease subunit S [Moraxella sp. CTOTU47915]